MTDEKLSQRVARRIRIALENRNISHRRAADAAKITVFELDARLRGETEFSVNEFIYICRAFHISPQWVIDEDGFEFTPH